MCLIETIRRKKNLKQTINYLIAIVLSCGLTVFWYFIRLNNQEILNFYSIGLFILFIFFLIIQSSSYFLFKRTTVLSKTFDYGYRILHRLGK